MRWYSQAGTPEVIATGRYDAGAKTYRLDLAQSVRPTPGQPVKEPMVIPLAIGLVGRDGARPAAASWPTDQRSSAACWCSTSRRRRFTFTGVAEPPVLSLNRGFSAPIKLDANLTLRRPARCSRRATAIRSTAGRRCRRSRPSCSPATWRGCAPARIRRPTRACSTRWRAILADASLEPAFVAEALHLPGEADIAREIGRDVDPDAIFRARTGLRALVGLHLNAELTATYRKHDDGGPLHARTPKAPAAAR